MISRVSLDFETTGMGYLEIARDTQGRVGELYHAPSTQMWRRKRGSKLPYIYKGTSDEVDFFAYTPGKRGRKKINEILCFIN